MSMAASKCHVSRSCITSSVHPTREYSLCSSALPWQATCRPQSVCAAPQQIGCTHRSTIRLSYVSGRRRHIAQVAGDGAPEWTLDQIAGLGFGAFLLITIYLALQVDVFVARSQRQQLGLCVDCGGVNDPASCPQPDCPMRAGREWGITAVWRQ